MSLFGISVFIIFIYDTAKIRLAGKKVYEPFGKKGSIFVIIAMPSNNYQDAIAHATKWLHKYENLSGNALIKLPVIESKYFCSRVECRHHTPAMCLVSTIRYFIERRIKQIEDRNSVWKGCISLWLSRVYPGVVMADDRIPWKAIYDPASLAESDQKTALLDDAITILEIELLPSPLASLFDAWPPTRPTNTRNVETAHKWLLDQLLNPPASLSFQLVQQLAEHYSQYPLFALEASTAGKFGNLTITPPLRLQEESTAKNIDQILEHRSGKFYIYGPPGSGKTVLSRYAVWRLATQHLNKTNLAPASQEENGNTVQIAADMLPLPFDVRQLDAFADRPTQAGQLKSLAVKQWTAISQSDDPDTEPTEPQWLGLLETPDLTPCPVVDNWDSLRLEPDLRPWRRFIERELRQFSTSIIFSRSPIPWLEFDHDRTTVYEIRPLTEAKPWQLRQFIADWATHTANSIKPQQIWSAFEAAPAMTKHFVRTPLELAMWCSYFVQRQTAPPSLGELLRTATTTIITTEVRLLSLPPGHIHTIADILAEIGWLAFFEPASNQPRETILTDVDARMVRQRLSSNADKRLFDRLCDSHFLTLDTYKQRISFPTVSYRDFFAAEKLVSLGREGKELIKLGQDRGDWSPLRVLYAELLAGE